MRSLSFNINRKHKNTHDDHLALKTLLQIGSIQLAEIDVDRFGLCRVSKFEMEDVILSDNHLKLLLLQPVTTAIIVTFDP